MAKKLWLLCFLCSACFAKAQPADLRILKSINQGSLPQWDNAMKAVSFSAYPIGIATPIGIWAHGYFKKDKELMRNGYKSAITVVAAMGISTGLKYLVQRQRPYVKYPFDIVKRDNSGTYSFPSGHSTAAFATATALSLTYKKWYVAVPAYAYAGLVSYSRMRLGMHYPTDVLGSAIIGVGCGWLTWKLDKVLRNRSNIK